MAIYGLVFLVLSSFGVVSLLPIGADIGAPWYVSVISIAIGLGVFKGFMNGGVVVDTNSETVVRWWGAWWPIFRRRIAFGDITSVDLFVGSTTLHQSDVTAWYDVALAASAKRTVLMTSHDLAEARDFAEWITTIVDAPIRDEARADAG